MNIYKIFTKEPIKAIEDIYLHKAIPLALEKLANNLEKNNFSITKKEIVNNTPFFIFHGMSLLRRKNEEGKKDYELFHGCILAAFLNGIDPNFEHNVYYPEDSSYDFLIIKQPRGIKPDFTLSNKEVYKNKKAFLLKVELAELIKMEELEKIIINKSKDKRRILLISIAFNGQLNIQDAFKRALKINQNNFETIWLMGQTKNPNNKNTLCYFIAELVKYKKVFPLFELLISWSKIKDEIDKAFSK